MTRKQLQKIFIGTKYNEKRIKRYKSYTEALGSAQVEEKVTKPKCNGGRRKMKNEILKAINKAIKQLCRTAQNRIDLGMLWRCWWIRRQQDSTRKRKRKEKRAINCRNVCIFVILLTLNLFEIQLKYFNRNYAQISQNIGS